MNLIKPLIFSLLCLLAPCAAHADETGSTLKVHELAAPSSSGTAYQENDSGQTRHEITVDGQTRAYQLYAPASQNDEPRPLLILFHGAGRTGVSLVEKWKATADRHNIVLAGPDGINRKWHIETDGPAFVEAVLKDVQGRQNIDPHRVYAFGHSMGGSFGIYLAILESQKLAAAAVHAGMFGSPEDSRYLSMAKRKIPMAFMVGSNDVLFPVEKVRATAQAFADSGHETSFYLLQGHTHWYYDIAPYINEAAWNFLSAHKLEP